MELENPTLLEAAIEGKKSKNAELWQLLRHKENLTFQKSRSKWIREGDTNSNFFHVTVNIQRKRNEIQGLTIGGSWVDEVQSVKEEIFNHFSLIFKSENWS